MIFDKLSEFTELIFCHFGNMAKRKLHPEEAKARLRIKTGTLTAFEAANGLSRGAVNDALRGKSNKTLRLIAQTIGVSERSINAGQKTGITDPSTSDFSDSHRLNEGAK
ncbi:helix-turn-helix domain-containing protein [Asticcacaulis sp. AND118]|uniref:helix-turn-helix domain-containing protein n=1 Tax=Asticcacaulis sp. AND118 TaxID=2840468 RepID=UPI001CFFBA63|nr:helix-turn-helix domain-containing protein [Asticcacaulis sp. AND118]UDF02992.1 helix-turn-helix domain-containing protein [Asticcacaulis sp. AND118]